MAEINEILIRLNIQGGDEATTQIGNLDKAIRQLDATYKLMKNSTDVNSEALGKNRTEVKALEQEKNRLLKTTVGTIQSQEAEEGSLTQLRIALSKATAEYNRMGEVKRNSVKGKELETSIINQTQAISALEQKMGNFRRNVGNYASGWNGLSNSINQVTRELPNFAQSATIGFMALSNNLPILVDEINRVRVANQLLAADGQKTTSVFKQIATSIFSWQSALITVISLSVIFAKEIGEFFFGVKKADEGIKTFTFNLNLFSKKAKEAEESQTNLNEAIKQFNLLVGDTNEYKDLSEILGIIGQNGSLSAIAIRDLDNALTTLKSQQKNLSLGSVILPFIEGESEADLAKRREQYYNSQKLSLEKNIAILEGILNKRTGKTKQSNKESVKVEEDYQKELLALVEQYHDLRIETMTDKNQQELYNEYEKHHRIIDALKVEATDNEQIVKQKNRNIEQEQKRHEKEMLRIVLSQGGNKAVDPTAEEAKRFDDATKLLDKKARERYEKRQKTEKEIEGKNRQLAIDAAINAAKQTVDAIAQIKQQELDRQLKRELTAIQRQSDGQDAILKHRLENGLITEATYAFEKQKLNEETAAKELEANRKMFEEKKRLDTLTAIANGALAITSILAQYPKFDYGIAAAIAIGAATATTATQVAVIQAQKFALGGKVNGKSHAQGGVMIEAEGGEGMINKNSMRSSQVMSVIGTPSQIASAINTTGGGVSWEQGATLRPNPNMFSNNSSSQSITYAQMDAIMNNVVSRINDKKVILLEADVTKTQNKVKAYESASKF